MNRSAILIIFTAMQIIFRPAVTSFLAALAAGMVYFFTLSPFISEIDAGELAAVAQTGGIPHPTGYPLFSILGWLFSSLPLFLSGIYQMNFFSLLCCCGGVFFFCLACFELIHHFPFQYSASHFEDGKNSNKKKVQASKNIQTENLSPQLISILSFTASLFAAFSLTWWKQSAAIEVYSLHIFLLSLFTFVAFRAFFRANEGLKPWLFVAASLALGFSNHLTFVLTLPGLAWLYFSEKKFNTDSWKTLGIMLLLFFPVLIFIYLWLPFRASSGAIYNWGDPQNTENFFRHVSGFQFQVWMFSDAKTTAKNFNLFWTGLPQEFGYIGLLLAAAGVYFSFIRNMKIGIFLLLNFFLTLFYSINYSIKDIEPYFLYSYLNMALFILLGCRSLIERLVTGENQVYLAGALACTAFFPLVINYQDADQSKRDFIEVYARESLNALPQNALLFSSQWDFVISPSYYLQTIENFRKDLILIDKELLRRSWYYKQLEKNVPDAVSEIKPEITAFLVQLQPFERSQKYDQTRLPQTFDQLVRKLLITNLGKRAVFVGLEMTQDKEVNLPEGYTYIPDRIYFRLAKNDKYYPLEGEEMRIHFPEKRDYYSKKIEEMQVVMKLNRALYELSYGKNEEAKLLREEAKKINPRANIPEALRGL